MRDFLDILDAVFGQGVQLQELINIRPLERQDTAFPIVSSQCTNCCRQ